MGICSAETIPVREIRVNKSSVRVGLSFKPAITWIPENASNRNYTLEVSNALVAERSRLFKKINTLRSGFTYITVIPEDGGREKSQVLLLDVTPRDMRSGHYRIPTGDINLTGTLALPNGENPHPAIVLISGSGMTDRHQLKMAALYLKANGIACLTYDKRGVGESEGRFTEVGLSENQRLFTLANDAISAIQFLKSRKDIDPARIGLGGEGQAGWIIPEATSRSQDIKFSIIISGPAVTVGQTIYYNKLTTNKPFNSNGTVNGLTIPELTEKIRTYKGKSGYNPTPALMAMTIPGFWLYCDYDEIIPTALSVELLEKISNTYTKDFTVEVYNGCNHSLLDIETNQVIPFLQITTPWLNRHVFKK